ncbi:membrane-bound metal-dependent hydrolase [Halalkaliarchaeum desulfuricum]|uniref:Membrane-bound metal-dependent hydrolase n=1 Tax=Halalkaliarchaeum desulfuricum TaxID=2055893 RepID=A0A343THA7_9EURY|nr:metal-dependent hydrolase [Halalkaliarchaeum desulfuricum]AUX08479.1 membrane-bound metal-dependent hydrolase [Halalkaliarchaeum desulfuricum]
MMLPTHALAGMALALPLFAVAPELAPVGLVAGLLGGIVPDLDMYAGHRKTLHYPVYYSVAAVPATLSALVFPSAATVAATLFLLGAALHCVSDVFGSGLELRPWEGNSTRAVYDHFRGRWIAPRRLIRYDGSPEDLLLSVGLALPLIYAVGAPFQGVVIAALAVAVAYTLLRRTLAELAPVVANLLPAAVRQYVPDRYLPEVDAAVSRRSR